MFTLLNVLLMAVAAANLYAVVFRAAPSVREITMQLMDGEGGLERLQAALTIAALAQVYLTFLVFPLKARSFEVGLAWALLMVLAACESIYTGRKMYETVAAGDRQADFRVHDSVGYRLWQIGYNLATIAACGWLVLPEG